MPEHVVKEVKKLKLRFDIAHFEWMSKRSFPKGARHSPGAEIV